MFLLRKIIINISTILGILFPNIFLIKKKNNKPRLTIYNLHSTSHNYFKRYKSILEKINKEEKFIAPDNIDDFFKQKYGGESFSLLTLDDGFANNLDFAIQVLDPLKIKAIFFIIPNLIYKKNDREKCLKFFNVLYPNKNKRIRGDLDNQFIPLSKANVLEIKSYGHTIGMHGFNHEKFSKLNQKEITKVVKKGISIFNDLNLEIIHFAYPFGDNSSFNNQSNNVLKKYFKYIHSGIRGSNNFCDSTQELRLLKRHPISSHKEDLFYYPISYKEIKFFTSNKLSHLLNLFLNKVYEAKKNIINFF